MIDIIVPVFNAAQDLQRCLDSLLRHTAEKQRLVLVNDASTDPAVVPVLEAFAGRRQHAELMHNQENLGFIGSCNRAMAASDSDVVLLNSDTQVTSGWLEARFQLSQLYTRQGRRRGALRTPQGAGCHRGRLPAGGQRRHRLAHERPGHG